MHDQMSHTTGFFTGKMISAGSEDNFQQISVFPEEEQMKGCGERRSGLLQAAEALNDLTKVRGEE